MSLVQKNILIIDDTASIRTFLSIFLQAHGANFFEASNAAEGLAMCKQHVIDLVVLDLGLPDRDGLDILPEIKTLDANGNAPKVIILSVRKDRITKEKAFALAADGYVSKPFLMEELLTVIEQEIGAP